MLPRGHATRGPPSWRYADQPKQLPATRGRGRLAFLRCHKPLAIIIYSEICAVTAFGWGVRPVSAEHKGSQVVLAPVRARGEVPAAACAARGLNWWAVMLRNAAGGTDGTTKVFENPATTRPTPASTGRTRADPLSRVRIRENRTACGLTARPGGNEHEPRMPCHLSQVARHLLTRPAPRSGRCRREGWRGCRPRRRGHGPARRSGRRCARWTAGARW